MISLMLLYKIFQLLIYMFLGFILVKVKVIRSEDSKILAKISLYLLMPAIILNAFDIEVTKETVSGLAVAFGAAFAIHILLLVIDLGFKRLGKGSSVERASIMYSNAGNLIIPIVTFLLGEEWVLYSCAFLVVQLLFIFTHGTWLFAQNEKFSIKKIFTNVNIISILFGAILMICGLRLPPLAKDIVSPLGAMIGPVAMISAGMLAADIDYGKMLKNKRLYLVLFLRMVFCPLVVLGLLMLLKFIPVVNVEKILLIAFLACTAPSASTVMQFAQIHNRDEDFAVAVNILSTLLCIGTMPLLVALYNML